MLGRRSYKRLFANDGLAVDEGSTWRRKEKHGPDRCPPPVRGGHAGSPSRAIAFPTNDIGEDGPRPILLGHGSSQAPQPFRNCFLHGDEGWGPIMTVDEHEPTPGARQELLHRASCDEEPARQRTEDDLVPSVLSVE